MHHEKIAVLDFGGQYAHLIANRIRRLGVYSEILDPETSADQLKPYKGLILSGGPASVYDPRSPQCDAKLFKLGSPVLGICYGHQLMQHTLGGKVDSGREGEYGLAEIQVQGDSGLFKNQEKSMRVWMSHFDGVSSLAPGFKVSASTAQCPIAAAADAKRQFYGLQFHPEVTHTQGGMQLLDQFLKLCQVSRDWSIEQFIQEELKAIKEKVGNKKVFLLVSGGVDSSVCFALLEKALGKERVYGMLVDTGLMRLNEAKKVKSALAKAGFENLHVANESERFLKALKGKTEPEEKRKIIGQLFLDVKEDAAKKLGLDGPEWIMGQGTIYPDTIETGGTKNAHTIKTHHNRVDAVQKLIAEGKVIEPIAQLYKDEVRALGLELGLPKQLISRQPFPGPGLGVRLLCASQADVEPDLDFATLNQEINEFIQQQTNEPIFAHVLPCKSVGVQGDERTYRHPVALFTELRKWEVLEKIATSLTNHFKAINRVMLTLHGENEPFEVIPADINPKRVKLLQKIDDQVTQVMQQAPEDYSIWQFPVVLIPTSPNKNKESIVLRPIVSTEAMTASFARIDEGILRKMVSKVTEHKGVSHLFYDLTHKPPGTIEWE